MFVIEFWFTLSGGEIMTQEFKDMLYLLGSAVNNLNLKIDHEINIEKIRNLSVEQGVWTLIYPELEKYCNELMYLKYKPEFLYMVAEAIRRNEFQLKILQKIKTMGINFCILKGISAATCYPNPDYRISSDTDILINSDDEKKITEFLKENDYKIKPREKNDHHAKAYHPIGGLLEIHVRLYSIPTEKIIFNNLDLYTENYRLQKFGEYNLYTLGINDELIYLTAHYLKHFINEGGGIRQMLDLLLFIEKNQNKIDFERYNNIMTKLNYDKLIDVIKSIGAKYCGFDYEIKYESLCDMVLTDSENGGIFGKCADNRRGFYDAYCNRRNKMLNTVLMFKREKNILSRIFPNVLQLQSEGYAHANCKVLYPFICIARNFKKIFEHEKNKSLTNDNIQNRLSMMKDLNMIK